MAAPVPAPLPRSIDERKQFEPSHALPIPPKLSAKLLNLGKTDRFFVNLKQKSHGKQWIATCLKNKGLIEIDSGFLPNPKCIFYWCQHEYQYFAEELFCGKENYPCISFAPNQGILCDKTRFASNLFSYYGNDAWKITPMTFDCDFDMENESWIISNEIKELIESKRKDYVWITKSNFGSLGSAVFLYRGNTLSSFQHFVDTKYRAKKWGKHLHNMGWYNTDHINLRAIIIQEYIDKPLLYNNFYKFDLRVYCLVASCNPCILFFHIGKMRVCGVKYNDPADINMYDEEAMYKYGHLSNCKIQRSHNDYDHMSASIDGQTMLNDWDGFIKYIYDMAINKKQFTQEWFGKYKYNINNMTLSDMKDLINIKLITLFQQLYNASKIEFDNASIKYNRPCQFMFQGNDVIIDTNGKFYVLEANRSPSLSLVGYETIKQMTKDMLKEMVDICLEIRQLKMKNIKVDQNTPLKSPHYWIKCKLDYKKPIVHRINQMIHDLDKLLE